MADLQINLDHLDQLFKDLLHTSIAFGEIEQVSKRTAAAVGHPALQHKVEDFSGKWDDRRKTIIESLDALWGAASHIGKTFTKVDGLIAAELPGDK
ncbi:MULTISPECIES: hypothetical protein [unclassified Nocardioides]|jgi:hypothetical protein|uniref:hypothetical protein n=1 Tax=unclassified Nocardioides TaxID=2615069 RepID=UPI00070364B8|nr:MULTISPECIES: hypothetical protein [unclassified Nocardioides]KRC54959.1 hypothetical protein ASE19_05785 [Nocardioides sp. Root79]KRC73692.1 hypothetical protein ASE20_03430 [Nocardioides sp. Root240]